MDALLGAQLIDHLQAGIILLDAKGRILAWNNWMTRHSGLALSEVAAKGIDDIVPETRQGRLLACIEQALNFGLSSVLTPGLNATILPLYQKPSDRVQDQRMQQLIYVTPIRHAQCACLIQIQDMTATARRERRLRAQSSQLLATSYRDQLTGVGNRRRFDHDLAKLLREAQIEQKSLALLLIDVDDFKAYNDSFGHPKGDECLIRLATTLQDALRQQGDRVSRYGGEEFALPLRDADLNRACSIAERLRIRVEELRVAHPTARNGSHVTVSIGLTAFVPSAEQAAAKTLIDQADLALYRAKDAGRNRCICYDPDSDSLRDC